ncbi:MAG: ribosomal protein L12E/L44/L45/RPP1/RPP2 [Rubritalea sp.]|jgi:ribosomal protein L12E/L44/L45/RPP1/RPP2
MIGAETDPQYIEMMLSALGGKSEDELLAWASLAVVRRCYLLKTFQS